MELQRSLKDITAQGLGLAAISYDSPDTLKAFADRHGITFPLLSDSGSRTITAWGILNTGATGRSAGIPYPGTYVIAASGIIRSRNFEAAYQERDTADSILAKLAPGAAPPGTTEVAGRHAALRLGASDRVAAPGHRLTLFVDVAPAPGAHVYAPGQTGYIPVALTLDASADDTASPAVYPASTPFVFAPLKETVRVYARPFRIAEDVTLALTPSMRQRATAGDTLQIDGRFEYQACDARVCFPPETLPLHWTVTLVPIER